MSIICITGPTASGKTALSVALAKELGGEIISCDSMQIYRGMDIGTAKPSEQEQAGIAHYMLSVVEPDEPFSAGRYREMAEPILQDILKRGKTAFIVGGTGLYMDALLSGTDFAPSPSPEKREELERRADELGMEKMLAYLESFDPESAENLPPNDRKRILRAIEIYETTGQTRTEHDRLTRLTPPKYEAVWLGLTYSDRAELYRRIDMRVEQMLSAGLWEETERLLASGLSPESTAMQAIGYKELITAIEGKCSREEAVALLKQNSRHYAKRQLTWFRRNEKIRWFDRSKADFPEIFSLARQFVTDLAEP